MTDRARILVLDDEVLVGIEISDYIEELGHEVSGPFTSDKAAAQAIARDNPDLALLDVNLGDGKTSEPVAKALRDADIPIIYVTATNPREIEYRDENDRVVGKPFSRTALIGAIRQALSRLEAEERRSMDNF